MNPAKSVRSTALEGESEKPFRHYSWRHRVIAWISQNGFDRITYTVRHGLLKGMKRRGGLGWLPFGAETAETLFWRSLDLRGKVVYDIGAFHGLLTLFFSRQAACVISFEPDLKNYTRLKENLVLNQTANVKALNIAAGSRSELRSIERDDLMPGGTRLGSTSTGLGAVEVAAIDELSLPVPDLIKIDTEGWELEVLKGAQSTLREHAPDLFLEMHGNTMREKVDKVLWIVNFLYGCGYWIIIHVESNTPITPENSAIAAQGHLYAKKH